MKKIALLAAGAALAMASGDRPAGAKAPAAAKSGGEREPVTARGVALLALIAGAGDAGLMLTQEEGLDAVNAGHATVDTSVTEGNTAKVTLTDAGRAALSAAGGGAGGSATTFEIEDGVTMPEATKRRGRQGGYPFELLNIGQSFHVPLGADDKEPADVAARLQSSVSGARSRFAVNDPSGKTETVTVKDYQKNADGSFAKDANGKRIVTAERQETRPVRNLTRDFKVMPVGADDPKGPGARVWRVALPEGGAAA